MKIICRLKKLSVVLFSVAAVVVMAVSASADSENPYVSVDFISETVKTAGESIMASVQAMVTAVVPILVGAAMAGLAIYGAKFIFQKIKSFLGGSAG
jgi:hypothetical protein